MRCEVLKSFKRRGELQLPGSIIEVPENMLDKLTGFVQALINASADSYMSTKNQPIPKAWLTDTGEFRTQGVFPGNWPDGGLTPEIIRLTADNLPLQAILLRRHCGTYSGPPWKNLVEDWNERAGIMQYDGGMTRQEADLAAAKLYRMEAFLDELI